MRPGFRKARRRGGIGRQLAGGKLLILLGQRDHLVRRCPPQEVVRLQFRRDATAPPPPPVRPGHAACSGGSLRPVPPCPAPRWPAGAAGLAWRPRSGMPGVAGLRLDAADREHEPPRGVAPVGPQRQRPGHVEGRGDLAATPRSDPVPHPDPDQRIVNKGQPVAQRHADMVHELQGAAPVPPSLPSTTMKSGVIPVASIALQIAMNSHGWPMHSLNPAGLPPDRSRICATNSRRPVGWRRPRDWPGKCNPAPSARPGCARSLPSPWLPEARRHGRA